MIVKTKLRWQKRTVFTQFCAIFDLCQIYFNLSSTFYFDSFGHILPLSIPGELVVKYLPGFLILITFLNK